TVVTGTGPDCRSGAAKTCSASSTTRASSTTQRTVRRATMLRAPSSTCPEGTGAWMLDPGGSWVKRPGSAKCPRMPASGFPRHRLHPGAERPDPRRLVRLLRSREMLDEALDGQPAEAAASRARRVRAARLLAVVAPQLADADRREDRPPVE